MSSCTISVSKGCMRCGGGSVTLHGPHRELRTHHSGYLRKMDALLGSDGRKRCTSVHAALHEGLGRDSSCRPKQPGSGYEATSSCLPAFRLHFPIERLERFQGQSAPSLPIVHAWDHIPRLGTPPAGKCTTKQLVLQFVVSLTFMWSFSG